MLAPVLYPFHRTTKLAGGVADDDIFGIKLPPDAETATDVTLVQVNAIGWETKHHGYRVPVVVGYLGRTIHSDRVRGPVPGRDSSPGLHGYPTVSPDSQVQLDHAIGRLEGTIELAVGLLDPGDLGPAAKRTGIPRIEPGKPLLYMREHSFGGVLSQISVFGEDHRQRFPDEPHLVAGKDRLTIGVQALDLRHPKVDRREFGHIVRSPYREHSGHPQRLVDLDLPEKP